MDGFIDFQCTHHFGLTGGDGGESLERDGVVNADDDLVTYLH